MTLMQDALDGRVIIHRSQVVAYMVIVQPYAGAGAEDFLLSCTSAQTHDGASILLSLGASRIENMTHIIYTHQIGHFDQAGFGIHFNLCEVRLPGHEMQPWVWFSF